MPAFAGRTGSRKLVRPATVDLRPSWITITKSKSQLALENLALRQQLAVLKRQSRRPKLRRFDRIFWVFLHSMASPGLQMLLAVEIAKARTTKNRSRDHHSHQTDVPRKPVTWGTPRIQSELQLLGYSIADSTVDKYRIKTKNGPSQTWRTFLRNHMHETIACDFFVVPTATLRVLFGFVVRHHHRGRIIHFNVTETPTAEWTALQIQQALYDDDLDIRFLLRDRDSIYGEVFRNKVKSLQLEEVRTQSPWQNPYAERMIGSLRREILDHVIVLGENHLRRIVSGYLTYYHEIRPHQSLDRNAPIPRNVDPPENGPVISTPMVGGLHHRYTRTA